MSETRSLPEIRVAVAEVVSKLQLRQYNPEEARRRFALLAEDMERLPAEDRDHVLLRTLRATADRLDIAEHLRILADQART
jgi:hypothetical protein